MKKYFISFVISTLTISVVGQINLTNGLYGFFPFSGNANDSSVTAINGVSSNTTLANGVFGNSNNSFSFNGINSEVNLGSSNRNVVDTVLVSAWVKTNLSGIMFILTKYDFIVDAGYHLNLNNGFVGFSGRNGSGNYINNMSTIKPVNDNKWHHVMGLVAGNTWEVWVDCELALSYTSATTSPSLVNSKPMVIGFNNTNSPSQHYFSGLIDEVRIYNRLLNQSEMSALCKKVQTAGIKDVEKEFDLTIFPNPSNGRFIFSSNFIINKIEIYSCLGELIVTTSENEIDISKFTNGIYYAVISDKSGDLRISKKIIKE
jgi:hypothetical protein